MKNLIITIAIVVLMSTFSFFQKDCNEMIIEMEQLKYAVDEAAATGVLALDSDKYSVGETVFDYGSGNEAIKEVLMKILHTDSLEEGNAYWKGPITYMVYYLDDTGVVREYSETSELLSQRGFNYGSLWTNPVTGKTKVINHPTVVITIISGPIPYSLTYLRNEKPITKTSYYEYVGY